MFEATIESRDPVGLATFMSFADMPTITNGELSASLNITRKSESKSKQKK